MMDPSSLALDYDTPEMDAAKRLFSMNQNNAQDTTIAKPNAEAIPTKDVNDNIAYARMMAALASGRPMRNEEFIKSQKTPASDDSQENESSKIKTSASGKGPNDNMTSTEVKTGMASNKSQENNHPQSAEVSKEGVANAAASTLDNIIKSGSTHRKGESIESQEKHDNMTSTDVKTGMASNKSQENNHPQSAEVSKEGVANAAASTLDTSTEGVEDIDNSEIIGYVSKVIGHSTSKGVTSYLCEWEPTEFEDGTVQEWEPSESLDPPPGMIEEYMNGLRNGGVNAAEEKKARRNAKKVSWTIIETWFSCVMLFIANLISSAKEVSSEESEEGGECTFIFLCYVAYCQSYFFCQRSQQ